MSILQGLFNVFTTFRHRHSTGQTEMPKLNGAPCVGFADKAFWRCLFLVAILVPTVSVLAAVTSTTTTLASGTNPVAVGSATLLTASVTGTSPSGTVTFKSGSATLGTGLLSGSGATRTATFSAIFTTTGSKSLTAVYGGNATNKASTSTAVSQTVSKANSTVTMISSINPSSFGASVTFTATLVGYTPSGNLTFMDGSTVLGTSSLSGTGNTRSALYASNALAGGSHSMTAVYAGDANNASSSSAALAQTVNPAQSSTTLASSLNPSSYGQNLTLTASVTGNNPSGNLTFMDGSTVLGTLTLNAGLAIFSSSSLVAGTHTLKAVYNGDIVNAASTSVVLIQTINKIATSTMLNSTSPNPSIVGQSITLTTSVTGINPSGTVTFRDGTTTLGIGTLNAGMVVLSTDKLSVGSHNLSAIYSGDANNATSISTVLMRDINQTASSTTLNATPNPASLGQNVTLIARINGYNPSGNLTFMDGSTVLGTVGVQGAAATLSLNSLIQGNHGFTAVYNGDINNLTSSSTVVNLTVTPRVGMTWQYGYDAMGRINTIVDPNGLASYMYYDSLGRPIQSQQPANTGSATPTIIQLGFNLADGLTSVTDPRNVTTNYSPNGLGNITSQSSPDSGASQYTYDAKGNLLTSLDARGKQIQYSYDSMDRMITITFPTGSSTSFEYDGGIPAIAHEKGQLTKISDESGQTSYSHDALGRLISKISVVNGKTFTTAYSWGDTGSALDKLTAITYPSGSKINYSYDVLGSVSAITINPVNPNGVGTGATISTVLNSITYNAENKISGWIWADGKGRSMGYDSVGQVSSYSLGDPLGMGNAAGTLRTLNRDSAGRIIGYGHINNASPVSSLDHSFGYDNLNRLLSASIAGAGTQYSYDDNGNRTSKTLSGLTYQTTIASTSNRLLQTQDAGATSAVTLNIQHDAVGNIVSDGVNSYNYSDRGRMSSAITAGGTVNYLYNGQNQRVGKSGPTAVVNTGAAYYAYDEAGQLLGEYDATGAPIYESIYLGSLPVGVMKQTGTAATSDITTMLYNLHADHMATPRIITRQDQSIVWRWDTAEAFGATMPDQNPSNLGTFVFNQRFPGQVFDAETGLFQNWNREYNARQGRYIQSDPIGLEGGINTFGYVGGNPLSYSDPDGLQPIPQGTYLPRGPVITGPPTISTNGGVGSTQAVMNQFTNMPNPSSNIPGAYVGINFPWLAQDLPIIPKPGTPYCTLSCPSSTPNSCPANQPLGLPKTSPSGERCTQVCYPQSIGSIQ
jgi:RHS repeat-associated protein